MSRLRALASKVLASFWLVPALVVAGAVALGVGLVELSDVHDARLAERWPRLFGVGAPGTREMLSAIASSMITVAGVVFSVTIVALSLTASTYSPRVLRTFMHDRGTQLVFGVFVGAFAYCLVVLRTIRGDADGEGGFVPSLATLGALVFALVAVGFLVYFIHHLATTIQASSILERVARETARAVDALFPEPLGRDEDDEERGEEPAPGQRWSSLPARRSGYIVTVDAAGLLAFAHERGTVLRMELGVGDFAVETQPLASLAGPAREDDADALAALYSIEPQRSIEQDAAFGMQQIVDIALKALSPGVNDATTALMCLDRLTAILVRLARRRVPSVRRADADALRVIAKAPAFADLVRLAYDPIRRNAGGKVDVLEHLLGSLLLLARATFSPRRRAVVSAQFQALAEVVGRTVAAPSERAALLARARLPA